MRIVRGILISVMFLIFGTGGIILNYLIFPVVKILYKGDKRLWVYSDIIYHLWRIFVCILEFCGLIRLNIKNDLDIKNKIIVSTHPSLVDVLILMSQIPRTTCFVKKELTKNPIIKNIVNSIFMSNDMELDELVNQSKKMLDAGFNIVIFPMGVRHSKDDHKKIKKGASLIALKSGKNIVPVKMTTTENFLFINEPFYAVGEKRVVFEIERREEINILNYSDKSDIVKKREITKAIEKLLYD